MTSSSGTFQTRPAQRGRVIGLGLGQFRFVGSGVALLLAAFLAPQVLAGPRGGQVVAGNATIWQHGNTWFIRCSNGSIINYGSFNVGANEHVRFLQPSSTARVLNRITGDAPTRIDGSIQANGIVYFANRAGVIFGPTAVINVGGIYAAAGNISNSDFLSGLNHFTGVTGTVSNAGAIDAKFAALIGDRVANSGVITAGGGVIAMVAGNEVTLSEQGGTISVKIDNPDGAVGATKGPAVENTGTLRANHGSAYMVAGDMYSLAVRNTGTVRARDITLEGRGKDVRVSGKLDASNQGPGATGGSVHITGRRVALAGADVDASGRRGGGEILVGGDTRGEGTLANAAMTTVDGGSTLSADATKDGNGGKIVVWSDNTTRFYGEASAAGGVVAGDGGFIETSGKINLDVRHALVGARARSATGKGGLWLMDPVNVNIEDPDGGVDNGSDDSTGGTFGSGTFNPDNSSSPAIVDVNTINMALNGGTNVSIITGNVGTDAGNINVNAAVSKTAGGDATFTLRAANDINVNATIGSTVGKLNVDLQANASGGGNDDLNLGAGDVTIGAAITTNGGTFSSSGVAYTQNAGGTVATAGGDVTLNHTGAIAINDTLDASGGAGTATSLFTGSTFTATALVTTGSGGMALRPADPAGDIRINAGAGDFNLSTSTLANLVLPSGGLLVIGRADGIGSVLIGSAGGGGAVDLSGLDANIEIFGGVITFNNSLTFGGLRALTITGTAIQDNHAGVDVIGGAGGLGLLSLQIGSGGSATLGTNVGSLAFTNVEGDLNIDNASNLQVGDLTVGGALDLRASGQISSIGDQFITGNATFVSRRNGGADISIGSALSTFGGTLSLRSRNLADTANAAGTITVTSGLGVNITQLVTTGDASVFAGDSSSIAATVSGTLTFGIDGTATVTSTSVLHLGASIATGDISITAPDVDITGTLTALGGNITLQPLNDSDTIGINSSGVNFSISTAELLNLAAAHVTIGRLMGTGLTSIGGLGAVDLSTTGFDLTLRGGAASFQDTLTLADDQLLTLHTAGVLSPNLGTDVVIGGMNGRVLIDTSAAVDLTTSVAVLAGRTSAGSITVVNAGSLDIGSIAMINGVTGAAGQNVSITTDGDLSLDNAVSTTGAGQVSLTSTTGSVIFNSGSSASSGMTGSVVVSADNDIVAPSDMSTLITAGSVTLTATNGDIGNTNTVRTAASVLSATAAGLVDITDAGTGTLDASIAGGATSSVSLSHAGMLLVGMGHSISGGSVSLTAEDLTLNGTISADGTLSISRLSDGTIGLGDATGDMTISKAELGRITADMLSVGSVTTTGITADNVSEADLANINSMGLFALADGADITFSGGASTFKNFTAMADDSINVNTDLTVSAGGLTLMADADMTSDADGDRINIANNVTVSTSSPSGGAINLTATGGVHGAGSLVLDANGALNVNSALSSIGTLTLTARGGGGITLGGVTSGVQITLTADNGVTIADNLTSTSGGLSINADADADGMGTLTLNAGKTIDTTGANLNITAADIALDGTINVGSATVAIARANLGTIGLGVATGDLQLSGTELSHITCGTLSLGSELTTAINIDTVAAGDTANISALINLLADDLSITGVFNTSTASLAIARGAAGDIQLGLSSAMGAMNISNAELGFITTNNLQIGGAATTNIFVNGLDPGDTANVAGGVTMLANGTVTFLAHASTFKSLDVEAAAGILVNANITTTIGDLTLNGDTNSAADGGAGNDAITIGSGRVLDSAGAMSLTAFSGGITGNGSLTLFANNGITLFNDLTTSGQTVINADHDADNMGTLTLSSGRTISTSGSDLMISAADLVLDGSISTTAGSVSITRSGMGTIGLGTAAGDMSISGGELGRIIATGLTIGGSTVTGMTISGVTSTNSNGIAGTTTLIAGAGSMTFNGDASTFNELDAQATGGITIASALVTDNGKMRLDGDSDHAGGDVIRLNNSIAANIPPATGADPTVGFNIDLVSDVMLGAAVTITGRDVKFEKRVNSAAGGHRALTVNTINNGVTTFGGDVGTVWGGGGKLFTLTTNADGLTQLGGTIHTLGTTTFNDAVRLTKNTVIDCEGGSGVFFNSTVDTANSSSVARNLRVLTVRSTNAGATNFPIISFAGNVGASKPLANIFLNYDGAPGGPGDGRANVPGVATIVARQRDSSGNLVTSPSGFSLTFNTTGTFRMGRNEKLTAGGTLTINAPTAAVLGDVNALGDLNVHSPSITLLRRAAGTLLGSQGVSGTDSGLDFVSGGVMNFTSVPMLAGTGENPRFGTTDGGGDVSSTLSGFIFQAFGPVTSDLINSSGTTVLTLDLRSAGPTNTNIADTIAGAIPRESRQNDVGESTTIAQAQFDQVKQLGIVPRNPTANELVELLAGSATYNDFPRSNPPVAEDFTTVVNRLPSDQVAALLASYDEIFNKPMLDDAGKPVLDEKGKARRESRTQEIQDALLGSVRRFRDAGGAKGGDIDPVAFHAYLEQTPDEAVSLGYLRQLASFLDLLDNIGLTARELSQSKSIILNPVRPRGIRNIQQFEAIIRAESQRTMR